MEVPSTSWALLAVAFLATLAFFLRILTPTQKPPLVLLPGPKPWPVIGNFHLLGPIPHISLHKLSQKYGPIMQLKFGSVPVVVASSSEAAKLFLKTYDHIFANRPQNTAAAKLTGNNHASVIWAPYGPGLLQWRKIIQSELFNIKGIESYHYIRVDETRALMSRLYTLSRKPVALRRKLSCFTLSIMSRIVLGKKYFSDSKDVESSLVQLEELQQMIEEFILLNGKFYIGDWIPWLGFLDSKGFVKRMKVV